MMESPAVAIVFRGVIAEKTQIKEVGRARQEFEWREVAFVQGASVGPDPANAVFFEKANDLWTMPAGMAKLDRKAEALRQLLQEVPQSLTAILWCKGGRQLNHDDLKLRFKRLDGAQKSREVIAAIAQPTDMRDFSGKLARETKSGRCVFHPAPHGSFRGSAVEGGIDLNSRKIMRIKFQPARGGQIGRIKVSSPFLKTPCASAEPDFLLCGEIQWTLE